MLMLLFYVDDQAYAIDCQNIFEVVPFINLEKCPHSLDYVSGIVSFEGRPITVVDFSQLISGKPSSFYLHTRIIFLVEDSESRQFSSLGIIAEKVIEVMDYPAADFLEPELNVSDFPFFDGKIAKFGRSIQRVDVKKLLQFLQAHSHDSRT